MLVAGSLIGGWVKFHSDYSRLSARVAALEADSGEFREDVRQMMKDIQDDERHPGHTSAYYTHQDTYKRYTTPQTTYRNPFKSFKARRL